MSVEGEEFHSRDVDQELALFATSYLAVILQRTPLPLGHGYYGDVYRVRDVRYDDWLALSGYCRERLIPDLEGMGCPIHDEHDAIEYGEMMGRAAVPSNTDLPDLDPPPGAVGLDGSEDDGAHDEAVCRLAALWPHFRVELDEPVAAPVRLRVPDLGPGRTASAAGIAPPRKAR